MRRKKNGLGTKVYKLRMQPMTSRWSDGAYEVIDEIGRRKIALWNNLVELFHKDRLDAWNTAFREIPEARDMIMKSAYLENKIRDLNSAVAEKRKEFGRLRKDGAVDIMTEALDYEINKAVSEMMAMGKKIRSLSAEIWKLVKQLDREPLLTPKAIAEICKGAKIRSKDAEDVRTRFEATLIKMRNGAGAPPRFKKPDGNVVIYERFSSSPDRPRPTIGCFLDHGKGMFRLWAEDGDPKGRMLEVHINTGIKHDPILQALLLFRVVLHRFPDDPDMQISVVRIVREKRRHGPYRWYLCISVDTHVPEVERRDGDMITFVPYPTVINGTISPGLLVNEKNKVAYAIKFPGPACDEPDFRNTKHGIMSRLLWIDQCKSKGDVWAMRHASGCQNRLAAMKLDFARKIAARTCRYAGEVRLPAKEIKNVHKRKSIHSKLPRHVERYINETSRIAAPMMFAAEIARKAKSTGIPAATYSADEYDEIINNIACNNITLVTGGHFWARCAESCS